MRLTEFAAAMGSRVENLREDFEITGLSTLERAEPGQVSFLASEKFAAQSRTTRASALIVLEKLPRPDLPCVPMREPWAGVLFLLERLYPSSAGQRFSGVHASSVVDSSAELGEGVAVGPNAVIGPRVRIGGGTVIGPGCVIGADCRIGDRCLFHAGVTISHGCVIGSSVILHPGAVIGADGFKYEVIGGKITKIPQIGTVIIEDNVEIGANSCVDRASFTETRIGANTKIDNLVQVAHNVQIGADCLIVSQTGIAGSTEIGDGSILAARAGIADNLKLGRAVRVMAQAGVKDDLPDGESVLGTPARPFRKMARIIAAEGRLPEMAAEIARMRARIEELEKQAGRG